MGAGTAGAGAGGARVAHAGGDDAPQPSQAGHFGRLFELPPFAEPTPRVPAALLELGRPGGLLDARDPLEKGPVLLITDPSLTAGTAFMAQFMDHDMTFDVGSPLGVPTRPHHAVNGRTPAFDLDSVYGGGPTATPQLYDPAERARLKVERGGRFEDLPRTPDRTAIIAPRRFVDWQTFFDFGVDPVTGNREVKPNKLIDTKISTPLFHLPLGAIASHDPPTALPQRTLLRHLTWELPSGQRIARHMGVPVLARGDLQELRDIDPSFVEPTPLWYYVLKEAEVMEAGLRLGPVGGRIVGEVIIRLLQTDPGSLFAADPGWRPDAPAGGAGAGFRMVDLLTFAGVDPASRRATP